MRQAYFQSSIDEFLVTNTEQLVGVLNIRGASFASQWTIATTSWASSIEILKSCFTALINEFESAKQWHILLEYEIPRLSSRVDAIIIANDLIFIIEFKYNRKKFELADVRQVEDYANDLADFHLESKYRFIIPLLLAPLAPIVLQNFILDEKKLICPTLKANANNFPEIIKLAFDKYHNPSIEKINYLKWERSEYQPTLSIIQAAQSLFAGQKVEEITRSGSTASDLKTTTNYLIDVINNAKTKNKKVVCFVTGIPGAGKTLVGLNIVHEKEEFGGLEDNTAYFSGNVPLINVLREALARDHYKTQKQLFKLKKLSKSPTKKESESQIKSKIQNLHSFIKDGIRKQTAPNERIVVFDEAQRCWNAENFVRKSKQNENRQKNPFEIQNKSEAELLFEFMDRHDGWSVIIALVGGGQEINTGEGGISEWGKALKNNFSNWEIHISEQLLKGDSSTAGQTLFDSLPNKSVIHQNESLHLSVSQRSFKATNLNSWVTALLENESDKADQLAKLIGQDYPLFITRNLETAKEWLKEKKSGNKRIGLVASSGGLRLKPYGIFVREEVDETLWFLNDEQDIRSSYSLEIVATEYKVQGLELDWVGICWDADLRRSNSDWNYRTFSGTRWNNSHSQEDQRFILNTYRVLLTRAREGMIIFVPKGNDEDETAITEFYDPIYSYLKSCGLKEI